MEPSVSHLLSFCCSVHFVALVLLPSLLLYTNSYFAAICILLYTYFSLALLLPHGNGCMHSCWDLLSFAAVFILLHWVLLPYFLLYTNLFFAVILFPVSLIFFHYFPHGKWRHSL